MRIEGLNYFNFFNLLKKILFLNKIKKKINQLLIFVKFISINIIKIFIFLIQTINKNNERKH